MTIWRDIILRSVLGVLRWLPQALVVALIFYAIFNGGYLVAVVGFGLIYTIFVAGLNIFMGHAGQTSFGQNGFAAIGAYASAVLTTSADWAPLPALMVGAAAAGLVALVIGLPTLRLRGHYLAMATLAIGLIIYEVAVEWQSVTNGYMGISGIPPFSIGSFEVASDRQQLVFLCVVTGLCLAASAMLRQSRFGRALVALSGSEDAARALGINVARYKLAAFVISAVYAALAGSLMAHIVGFLSPEMIGMNMVILAFTMLYVGGIGSTTGPLLGAMLVSLLPEIFRPLKDYQDIVYGVCLILILIYAPRGLAAFANLRRREAAR